MPRKTVTEKSIVVSAGAAAAAPARRKAPAKRVAKTNEPVAAAVVEAMPADPTYTEPTHEEIAALAYSYWEARGCVGGSQEEDWLRAEQELRSR